MNRLVRRRILRACIAFGALTLFFSGAARSVLRHAQELLQLPFGPVTRLTSPDDSHDLYGVSPDGKGPPTQLWIRDTNTWLAKQILDVTGTIDAAWSPDGNAFFVRDNRSSDSTRSYIYQIGTLNRIDVEQRILAADAGAKPFSESHAYFSANFWPDSRRVVVDLTGHTDSAPVKCFDLKYRVNIDGSVQRLSRRIGGVHEKYCGR